MNESKPDIAALALELVGEFSKLQDTVDNMVRMYAEKRAPSLAQFLADMNTLDRLSDIQRPRLVISIAKELETTADLSKFGDVFRQVKDVRDFVAHGTFTERVSDDELRIWNNYLSGPNIKRSGIKKLGDSLLVTRPELTARLKEARWLILHVHYIVGSSDLTEAIYLGEQAVTFVEPPADPRQWNEQVLTCEL